MPVRHPPEFRQRAVELARMREKPSRARRDLGSPSRVCGTGWPRPTVDEGRRAEGLTTASATSWCGCVGNCGCAKLEIEILKRAAAYFAQENVLPK